MIGRIVMFAFLLVFAAFLWYIDISYDHPYLEKGLSTLVALAGLYLVFKIIFEEIVAKQISEFKARYSFRKAVSIVYFVVVIITIIAIWIESPEALLVTYGLIAAGIAVALQDLFKNLAGGLLLLIFRLYKVGDRIEINQKCGDVIDIDILYTTLLEIKEWVDGDQATGRLVLIPNHFVLSGIVHNYTKDNDFIWDEVWVPVTYDSDWSKAASLAKKLVEKETDEVAKKAQRQIKEIQKRYYLSKRPVEPSVYMKMTDNWVSLYVRYVTNARERRVVNSRLSTLLLKKIEKTKGVKLASATVDIVGFPEIRMRKK
ncbi:mechanosensitive ion channel [Candidatus Micrarchaeota archaeon]|nr:mechanosensitive ion channel [Candidatus Micrarchaeota archaeon]